MFKRLKRDYRYLTGRTQFPCSGILMWLSPIYNYKKRNHWEWLFWEFYTPNGEPGDSYFEARRKSGKVSENKNCVPS